MTELSPEEVDDARFPSRLHGYDREVVDAFLAGVAQSLRAALASQRSAQPYRELGEEIGEFLQHAKDAADQLRQDADRELLQARRDADKILERAEKDAEKLKLDALHEAEDIRGRASEETETSKAESEQQRGRARSYAIVVVREAERSASQVIEEARKEAESLRAEARRERSLELDQSERKVRQLRHLELSLTQKVNAAEAKLGSLTEGRSDQLSPGS